MGQNEDGAFFWITQKRVTRLAIPDIPTPFRPRSQGDTYPLPPRFNRRQIPCAGRLLIEYAQINFGHSKKNFI